MSSKAVFSWSRGLNGPAITFEVKYIVGQGSFKTDTTTNTIYEIDNLKPNTKVRFRVRSVGVAPQNKKSKYTTINITIPKASQSDSTSPVTPTVLLPPDPENVSVEATTKN